VNPAFTESQIVLLHQQIAGESEGNKMAHVVERTALQIRDCSLCGAKQPNLIKVYYNIGIHLVTWDCATCKASQGDEIDSANIRVECSQKIGCQTEDILGKQYHDHDLNRLFGGK
jgi:hypothetical protein